MTEQEEIARHTDGWKMCPSDSLLTVFLSSPLFRSVKIFNSYSTSDRPFNIHELRRHRNKGFGNCLV